MQTVFAFQVVSLCVDLTNLGTFLTDNQLLIEKLFIIHD